MGPAFAKSTQAGWHNDSIYFPGPLQGHQEPVDATLAESPQSALSGVARMLIGRPRRRPVKQAREKKTSFVNVLIASGQVAPKDPRTLSPVPWHCRCWTWKRWTRSACRLG